MRLVWVFVAVAALLTGKVEERWSFFFLLLLLLLLLIFPARVLQVSERQFRTMDRDMSLNMNYFFFLLLLLSKAENQALPVAKEGQREDVVTLF